MDPQDETSSAGVFRLGRWRVDPGACALSDGTRTEHVEPRAMAVLSYLAAHAGRTVSRDELLDEVWKTRHVVEEVLTRCISQLRQILEDDPHRPTFIQTIPKVGYRLLVPPNDDTAIPRPSRRSWFRTSAALGVLLALGAVLAWWRTETPHSNATNAVKESSTSATDHASSNSVAILPFQSFSQDPESIAFADGVTEELIQLLASVPDLKVPSRTSSFYFKDHPSELPAIAAALGVANVLEGSVRRDGRRIRITVQLIAVQSNSHLWSESFDRDFGSLIDLQKEIATTVAQRLNIALDPALWRHRRLATTDMTAYQAYGQARSNFLRGDAKGALESIDLFKVAVERDPNFAPAWASLAFVYWVQPALVRTSPEQMSTLDALTLSSARRALAIDPQNGIALAVLADMDRVAYRWREADRGDARALAAAPGDVVVLNRYAETLCQAGRLRQCANRALTLWQIDPLSYSAATSLATVRLLEGRDEEARQLLVRASALGATGEWIGIFEAYVNLRLLNFDDARRYWAQHPDPTEARAMTDVISALQKPERRTAALAGIRSLPAWDYSPFRGRLFAACLLGEREAAFEAAQAGRAAKLEPTAMWWIREASIVRGDARFVPLMQEMNLVAYWQEFGFADDCAQSGAEIRCH